MKECGRNDGVEALDIGERVLRRGRSADRRTAVVQVMMHEKGFGHNPGQPTAGAAFSS